MTTTSLPDADGPDDDEAAALIEALCRSRTEPPPEPTPATPGAPPEETVLPE